MWGTAHACRGRPSEEARLGHVPWEPLEGRGSTWGAGHVGPAGLPAFPLNSRCAIAQASFELCVAEDDLILLPPHSRSAAIGQNILSLKSFPSSRACWLKRLRQEDVKFPDSLG